MKRLIIAAVVVGTLTHRRTRSTPRHHTNPGGLVMTTYSPAAEKYASDWFAPDTVMWHELARTYDAALASARQPERVLITSESERDALPMGSVVARFHTDGSTPSVSVRGTEGWLMATEQLTPLIYHDGRDRVGNRMAPLTLLVPATVVPAEPVRLTGPDPRWRDGAKVRGEWPDGSACEGWLSSLPILPGKWFIKHGGVGRSVDVDQVTVYLLAEAPDPDADTRQALIEIMTGIGVHDLTTDEATQVIMGLRERGVTL